MRGYQATFTFQKRPDKPSGGLINHKGVGGRAGKCGKQGGLISGRAGNFAIQISYYPMRDRPDKRTSGKFLDRIILLIVQSKLIEIILHFK